MNVNKKKFVMVVNSSFQEMDWLALKLEELKTLSNYIRPYFFDDRRFFEICLNKLSPKFLNLNGILKKRIFRGGENLNNFLRAGKKYDLVCLLLSRLNIFPSLLPSIVYYRNLAISKYASNALSGEKIVVASAGCAYHVFKRAKEIDAICILNASFAHHRYATEHLLMECKRTPLYSKSMNGHNFPAWLLDIMDVEISLADYILVGSSFVKISFEKQDIPAEKIFVLPYGVDTELYTNSIDRKTSDSNSFNILFVGQITQRKGISYLIEVFDKICVAKKNVSLTMVGSIPFGFKIPEGGRKNFRVIPHAPKKDLVKLYADADVFLFPTLMEGMPIVVLEAMACGLPVITSNMGPDEVVRDGLDGFIVDPRNIEMMVDKLTLLIENQALKELMGKNARERAVSFNWERYQSTGIEIINKLLTF